MKDMLGRDHAIPASEALRMFFDRLPSGAVRSETVVIENALGRIAADVVVAQEDLPAFPRSTVDGFGVRAEDTFGARETMPAYLTLDGEVFMGAASEGAIDRGRAMKVPTGGMLPLNADAVVMFEHAQPVDETTIEVLRPVAPGENVIQAGEDLRSGDVVLRSGSRIRPQEMGALAGIGVTSIAVSVRPRVSIISTGDEIVPAAATPAMGQVRDINSYVIAGMAREAGGVAVRRGIFADDYQTIRDEMERALKESEVIVLSGGTSVGTRDMVARIIGDVGSPGILFHGLALKPGKPMIGGMLGTIPVLGLPGHPAAVALCCELFLKPLIGRLLGCDRAAWQDRERVVKARLDRNVASTAGREEHIRVLLELRDSDLWAVPLRGKSGLIATLVKADGTIVIPLHVNGIEQGETVDVRLF